MKATMVTPWGTYRFKKLAMGLRNSAQSFQRLIDHVLVGLPKVFAYMDDILIYAENDTEHAEIVEEVLKRLDNAGLSISAKKCVFECQ